MSTPDSEIILIVDDTPTNLAVLSEALTSANYQVAVALDGETALEQVSYKPPHLILLDVMMPGIDGFETCQKLKENPLSADIPIIFMTALSDAVDKVNGLSLGAVDYITKPFQQEEVLARVNVHLQLRHLNQTLQQSEAQLRQQAEHLRATLNELKRTQNQLVQSEKMSALGQLVAGVAHEINNPVTFIYSNLSHADKYTQDLVRVVDAYQKLYPEANPDLEELIEEVDLAYLIDDLPQLLTSMRVGAQRIRDIVRSLRNFSRLDESEFKAVNLHDGIESTLMILQNRLKAKPGSPGIEIVRCYGNLPLVECYAGQINQVLMNILSNAVDALEERDARRGPSELDAAASRITITTAVVNQKSVQVVIADNGVGIPPQLQSHIFDPFFTTKSIGKGTGLGMSISYKIITDKHQGKLTCTSESGLGTSFTIEIPIRQRIKSS